MKATTHTRWTVLALLAMSLAASHASADMIYNGMGYRSAVTIQAPGLRIDTQAGQLRVEFEQTDYLGYCVDIYQNVADGPVDVRSVESLPNGEQVAFLFETYADGVDSDLDAAALQVAIWEVVNEDDGRDFNAKNGSFRIVGSGNVRNLANDLLDTLPDSYTPSGDLAVLFSDSHQDILVGGRNSEPVPEPATMSLLALGGVMALLRRRRRR